MKTTEHVIIKANFLPKFNFQILDNTSVWIFSNRRKQNQKCTHPQQFLQTQAGTHQNDHHVPSVNLWQKINNTAMCSHYWWWVLTFWFHLRKKCIWHLKKLNVLPLCILYRSACFLNIAIKIMSFNSIYSFSSIKWDKIWSHIKKGTGIMVDMIHEVHQPDAT